MYYILNIVKSVFIIAGWNGILAQGQYGSEAPGNAPPNQYMTK